MSDAPEIVGGCGTCRFYMAYGTADGECRRHAPTPLLDYLHAVLATLFDGDLDDRAVLEREMGWPVVEATMWCGEWAESQR